MTRDEIHAYLLEQAAMPFAWGTTDCVQMAAGAIERARGVRPALPSYSTELEAKRALVELGGLETAVSAVLGPAQRDLRSCADGDIVLTAFEGQQALGVAMPRFFYLRHVVAGLIRLDLTLALRYWPCQDF